MTVKLRYDGRYTFITDVDNRQWTILSHFIGPDGADYFKSSRMYDGLIELGVLPAHRMTNQGAKP